MGGSQSLTCRHPVNPDLRSVFTLSDSAVERLPLDVTDSPLEREQRKQNIDDFWRDRLSCLDKAYLESKLITETEFRRLERTIKNQAETTAGKLICLRVIDDAKNCYLSHPEEPMNCRSIVEKLQLCLNTTLQEASKKRMENSKKEDKKPC